MRNRNLIGETFNDLLVIERADPYIRPNGTKLSMWKCKCICGKETTVSQNALITGSTKSCGCRNARNAIKKRKDLSGQRFGKLTVISLDHRSSTPNGTIKNYWLCKCDCGKEKVIRGDALLNGYSTSCGCVRSASISERMTVDLTGQQFGLLTVLHRAEKKNKGRHVIWLCQCKCGNLKEVNSSDLVTGHTSSCGCIKASTGEYLIAQTLDNIHVKYKREVSFNDLTGPNGGVLRFDFGLYNEEDQLLCLIEYQGEQHYMQKSYDFGTLQREITDPLKRMYCIEHNIPLFEISFQDNILKSLREILKSITLHANPVPRLQQE